eukprot:4851610-Prymnesium_polylepis.1
MGCVPATRRAKESWPAVREEGQRERAERKAEEGAADSARAVGRPNGDSERGQRRAEEGGGRAGGLARGLWVGHVSWAPGSTASACGTSTWTIMPGL